ncbi:hypothetical protein CP533_2888 [Ophiocordyceps camponoti-saundersi (nom. inval.)]|nr:hypothetical protein CP533_2888 [Ophiocordyceps camponoti-saundersi (nom. inval.)]
MADPDFDLSLLQDVLGREVTLKDPKIGVPKPDDTSKASGKDHREPRWELLHAKAKPRNEKPKPSKSSAQTQPRHPELTGPTSLDCHALSMGDMLRKDIEFCPWTQVVDYPDRFIGKKNKPRALPFFDKIFQRQSWDFFYLHNPRDFPGAWPELFVQTNQFEDFLRAINRALDISLTIPPGVNSQKFRKRFGNGGTPRPHFMFQSDDKHTLDGVSWPAISQSDIQAFEKAPAWAQADFISTLTSKPTADTQMDKAEKAKERSRKRALHRRTMMEQTQTFLGLRDPISSDTVVFVCVDVEALEDAPRPISEIGIAILDTDRLRGIPSAASGSGWWPFIQAHHLRTKEHSSMVNSKYVQGCPDAFDFGTSEFPAKNQLVDTVYSILKPYIDQKRKMAFVAHDTPADLRYFSDMGLDILNLPGMLCEIDTKVLHQLWQDSEAGRSLSAVLSDLNFVSQNLHNAGNDAVYTMRAVVGLAIEQLRKEDAELRGELYCPTLWAGRP